MSELTRVDDFGGWYAKREDLAEFAGHTLPSGAKVRQYLAMIKQAPDNAILLVGCSADSAMQIYVAYAAAATGRDGYVFVPYRKERSAATVTAMRLGALVTEVKPGYPAVYRARAREFGKECGRPVVRWDLDYAAQDTVSQVHNTPEDVRRIVVPTGSGLTAAGVLAAVTAAGRGVRVLAVCVSDLANKETILATANKRVGYVDPDLLDVVRPSSKYGQPAAARLPDGSLLDPYYAAKALPYVQAGDMLWVSGRRPA